MKTPAPPDWPPIISSGRLSPIVRVRDTILTVVAWVFVIVLFWELFELLRDYFTYPVRTLNRHHSPGWLELLERIGKFVLVSSLLVSWLALWGFVRRKELRRNHDARPVPPLSLTDHAALFEITPETLEQWRKGQVVVAHFNSVNRLENVAPKDSPR